MRGKIVFIACLLARSRRKYRAGRKNPNWHFFYYTRDIARIGSAYKRTIDRCDRRSTDWSLQRSYRVNIHQNRKLHKPTLNFKLACVILYFSLKVECVWNLYIVTVTVTGTAGVKKSLIYTFMYIKYIMISLKYARVSCGQLGQPIRHTNKRSHFQSAYEIIQLLVQRPERL